MIDESEKIIDHLLFNCDDWLVKSITEKKSFYQNDKTWSLAELFIRQWKNNGGDGFGLHNVEEVYYYLVQHKKDLRTFNMISKQGHNNSGYPLWDNYKWDTHLLHQRCLRQSFDF